MNALKFLAVNRSLDSEREVVGRFQVNATGLLPVFDGSTTTNGGDAFSREAGTRESTDNGSPSMWRTFFGWLAPSRGMAETRSKLTETSTAGGAGVEATTEVHRVDAGEKRAGLLASANPFARKAKPPAQSEFRFENVRVVCNELHDTDFIIKA